MLGVYRRKCICDFLFRDFVWVNLASTLDSELPKKPGTYVLRLVISRDENPLILKGRVLEAYSAAMAILKKVKWERLTKYWGPRIERLKRIDPLTCPTIYIGSTGKGKGTIRSRFADLAGLRHTIFPCVLALRLVGWDIEFGYKIVSKGEEAFKIEERLMREYMKTHGMSPPLNEKAGIK